MSEKIKFKSFEFESVLNQNLENKEFTECTAIQEAAIPLILKGTDVSGLAQTGTGKTAAYLLPLIDRILKAGKPCPEGVEESDWSKRQFADWDESSFVLVLVPTRELADQVNQFCQEMIQGTDLRSTKIYGGDSYERQQGDLNKGCQFVFATPGRLIDLFKRDKMVDFKKVKAIIFDEADRMFDMGFKDDMKYILNRVPKDRQFLIFSATLNFEVTNVAYSFGAEPVDIDVSRDQLKTDNVQDAIVHIGSDEKPRFLLSMLKKHKPRQAIVFSNYKVKVEKITQFLVNNGVSAKGISSLLSQAQRKKVIEKLKAVDENYILVATDVAARGLDIKEVDMVVNFDLPEDAENYVHRIGRTGRAGAKGIAFSLVSETDVESLSRIESYLDNKLPVEWLEEGELVDAESMKPMPRNMRMANKKLPANRGQRNRNGSKRGPNDKRPERPKKEGGKYEDKPRRHAKSSKNSPSEHRDRKTGRHKPSSKGHEVEKSSESKKPNNKKFNRRRPKNNDPKMKRVYSGGNKSSGSKFSGKPKTQKSGLVGRVSSMFKKMFE